MKNSTGILGRARPRIRILCQYFYPDTIVPGHLLSELAEELVRLGCEVEIFAGRPTCNEKRKSETRPPASHGGISVHRVWNTRFNRNTLAGRALNTATFAIPLFLRMLFREKRTPWLIVTEPPFLGVFGWIFKKIFRVPFIILLHDIFPDIAVRLGYFSEKSSMTRFWDGLNKRVLAGADHIVVIGRKMKSLIEERLPEAQLDKIEYIPNWADGDLITPAPVDQNGIISDLGLEKKFVVQYSGNMGLIHDVETIILAADVLRKEDVHFLFIGSGAKKDKIEKMARELGLENVSFLPFQPREKLGESLTACHVGLVALEKPIQGLAVPSKFYGILAAGRPIIALMSSESEIGWAIRQFECGIASDQKDVGGLVKAIRLLKNDRTLLARMGMNARKAFDENYTIEECAASYYDLIKNVCTTRGPDRRRQISLDTRSADVIVSPTSTNRIPDAPDRDEHLREVSK